MPQMFPMSWVLLFIVIGFMVIFSFVMISYVGEGGLKGVGDTGSIEQTSFWLW